MKHAKTLRSRVSQGETPELNALRALSLALAAVFFAASFSSCEADSDIYDDLILVQDRTTRQYSIILPEPGERGGISASHASAKQGTIITVSYIPPETAENTSSYTITSLTGAYDNGKKNVNFSKGGGGGWSFSMPGADVTLSAEYGELITTSNASLSSIIIYSGGDETARSEITTDQSEYILTVPHQVETIQILAKTADIQAFPTLNRGNKEFLEDIQLAEGGNSFEITVVSSDNSTIKDYKLVVKRAPDLSLSEFKITGIDNPGYTKGLDVRRTSPQAVTVTEQKVFITAIPANSGAEVSGDVNEEGFTVDSLRYEKKTVTVSASLDGEEYKQDYIVNVCYSTNPDDVGMAHVVMLMSNYAGAKNGGVYRKIIVPVTGSGEEGDIATLQEGLEEASVNIEREYYEFEGWYESVSGGLKFDSGASLTAGKTLYAHWKPVEYTFKFDYNYPIDSYNPQFEPSYIEITGNCETPLTTPPAPEHPHYTFAGWYAAGGAADISYALPETITETQTVYAHWTGKSYSITFDAGDGATPRTQNVTVTYPSSITPPELTPSKENYSFAGWYDDSNDGAAYGGTDGVYTISNYTGTPAVLYAHWTSNVYKLYLNANEGTEVPSFLQIAWSSVSTALPIPVRAGYTFEGWYSSSNFDGTSITAISNYTGNPEILHAKWKANIYRITFYDGNTVVSTSNVAYGSTVMLPELPAVKNASVSGTAYSCDRPKGWYTNKSGGDKLTSTTVTVTANADYYVQWEHSITYF
jgi:uncharacterized repeat protein (TIGR02543 family)